MKKERVRTTKSRTQPKKPKAASLSRPRKKVSSASSKKNLKPNKATERIKKAIRFVAPAPLNAKTVTQSVSEKTFFASEDYSGTPLPFSYNDTRLVLLVRDPEWAYGYWDFSASTWDWLSSLMRKDGGSRAVLRIHNIDESSNYDLNIDLEAKNWYINLGNPEKSFEAELGLIDSQGRFYSIVRSNRIRTPRKGPSAIIDKDWESDDFDEIYRLSGGGQAGQSASGFASSFMEKKKV